MKKIIAFVLVAVMALGLVACDTSSNDGGEVAVLWYDFSDAYLSTVRSAMTTALDNAGVKYQHYDAQGDQATQTNQVTTALSANCSLLVVNVVDTGSKDAAQNIVNEAKAKDVPVVFFNRSVEESVVSSYDKCVFVGTDYEMAGHMQGEMIGNYTVENFDSMDLNGDGKISYVMFKGQQGNMEAEARTQYGVEDANKVLTAANKPALEYYDAAADTKYLVDADGKWSAAAAKNHLDTVLSQYSEDNGNMVELIIANNDEMALGAISSLQEKGYNKEGGKFIPVFGVDATDSAKDAIAAGTMMGSIKQDAEGMANTIAKIVKNYLDGKTAFDGVDAANVVGTWRVNIPYAKYTG